MTTATLTWLGCTTFLLEVAGARVLLDAYVERVPAAPPTGAAIERLGPLDAILVGHSHHHHIADAPAIAGRSGAKVIGHPAAAAVLREAGVPGEQVVEAVGGERFRIAGDVTVRTLPALHACDWAPPGQAAELTGLDEDQRASLAASRQRTDALLASGTPEAAAMAAHLAASTGSDWHGGVIAYLVEWPGGSLLFQDSVGAWSATWAALRPDVAVLSAAGVPNLDGEPFAGSLPEFVLFEAALLGWPLVIPGHHDNWMPPFTSDGGDRETALAVAFAEARAPFQALRYSEPFALPSATDLRVPPPSATIVCPICEGEVRMLYTSTDEVGHHARLFCIDCVGVDPEHRRRIEAGLAHLCHPGAAAGWALRRVLDHASANERRKRSAT